MKWITVKKANAKGKPVPLGTKGEGDIPASLVGKVQFLPEEAKADIDLTDKKAVVAELERLKIEFDGRKGVEELAALLPKA